jgi:hypothetical protein
VFGQYLDGLVRVAGEGEFAELAVFPGQVALVVVGEYPVPPAVELSAVADLLHGPGAVRVRGDPSAA